MDLHVYAESATYLERSTHFLEFTPRAGRRCDPKPALPARIEWWRNAPQDYRLVTTAEDLAAVAETLQSAEAIGLDIETTALSPRDGRVRLLQLATPEETFVIDLFEVSDLSPLKEVLEGGPVKVGHNLKFEYQFLHALHGISPSPRLRHDARSATPGRRQLRGILLPGSGGRALPGRAARQIRAAQRLVGGAERGSARVRRAGRQGLAAPARTSRGLARRGGARTDLADRVRGRRLDSRDGAGRHQARRSRGGRSWRRQSASGATRRPWSWSRISRSPRACCRWRGSVRASTSTARSRSPTPSGLSG